MSDSGFILKRPTRASFKNGRALHDIYDSQGIKWIAKGQLLSDKQIEVALQKGSLTKKSASKPVFEAKPVSRLDLKPTFEDISELTDRIEAVDQSRNEDLRAGEKLSEKTRHLIQNSSTAMLDLMQSNRFSPYKLTGLTNFLYGEVQFQKKRDYLKTLNNSGTQYTLFSGIVSEGLKDLMVANLLNPASYIRELALASTQDKTLQLDADTYQQYCQDAARVLIKAIQGSELESGFTNDLIRYFSPRLYFTSAEVRLFQQVNTYLDFLMPEPVTEAMSFTLSDVPIMNFAQYFKQGRPDSSLGVEGSRIIQYVGLIPPGTAIQFSNREKAIVIAPKNKDTLYSVTITGMDGQPLLTPSLREIHFRDLNHSFRIIPSYELPLKYETHAHEKIWKMHIVHENLRRL